MIMLEMVLMWHLEWLQVLKLLLLYNNIYMFVLHQNTEFIIKPDNIHYEKWAESRKGWILVE